MKRPRSLCPHEHTGAGTPTHGENYSFPTVTAGLWSQNPAIALHVKDDALMAVVDTSADGEEDIVAARIRAVTVSELE